MTIKLYHYNEVKFDILKTFEKQGKVTKEEIRKESLKTKTTVRPGAYYQHISFFLLPINVKDIAATYRSDHFFWYSGNKLVEHVVLLDDINDFKYEFVETPEKTKLYYDDSIGHEEYYKLVDELNVSKKYIGNSKRDFSKAYNSLINEIKPAYEALKNRSNWDIIKTKYAATIPHVMIYPKEGTIKIHETKQITLL